MVQGLSPATPADAPAVAAAYCRPARQCIPPAPAAALAPTPAARTTRSVPLARLLFFPLPGCPHELFAPPCALLWLLGVGPQRARRLTELPHSAAMTAAGCGAPYARRGLRELPLRNPRHTSCEDCLSHLRSEWTFFLFGSDKKPRNYQASQLFFGSRLPSCSWNGCRQGQS